MTDVQIVEVSPRDGLQNEKQLVSTADKAALVRRALDAGARRIEVTAFAHPERVPQMADAEAVMAEVRDDPRLRSIGLVLNRRGLDRAIAAGCHEATVVVVVSDGLALKNQGVDTAAQVAAWQAMADDARSAGLATTVILAASFGCPFDGEVPTSRVLEVARGVLDGAPRRARDRGHDRRRRTRPGAVDRLRPARASTPRSRCARTSTTPATPATPTRSPRSSPA